MEIRLGREAALLREILREKPDHGSAASLVRDTEWFDWDLFEELLFRSRVVPLVSATVSNDESFSDLLPEALCRRLHHEKERAIVRSILKAHELHQVLNRFQLNDIEPIVLKGLPFALRYFDDPAHRDVRDLDLLVAPEQLRPAERVLRSLGYSLFEGVHSRNHYRRHHFHVVYVRKTKTIDVVELHWNLLHPPSSLNVRTEDLYRRKRTVPFEHSSVNILSALDELVYIMVSLRMAFFVSLRRLVDLDRALRRCGEDITTGEVVARGGEWGISDEVLAGYYFLEHLLGYEEARVEMPSRIGRFASRFRAADFFGLSSRRELRLRMWCSAFFGRRGPLRFARQALFPDEDAGAELYYSREETQPGAVRIRRTLSGLASLLDVSAHMLVSPFRRLR